MNTLASADVQSLLLFCTLGLASLLPALVFWHKYRGHVRAQQHTKEVARLREVHKGRCQRSRVTTITNSAGLSLYMRVWDKLGDQAPCAILVMIHGYALHSAYFEPFAALMNAVGVAVYAYDLQGHGLSEAAEGRYTHVHHFSDHLEDATYAVAVARQEYPGVPLFMFGESLGGAIVLQLLRTKSRVKELINGIILSAPAIQLAPESAPSKAAMAALQVLDLAVPSLPFRIMRPSMQTWLGAFEDPAVAEASWCDPLCVKVTPTAHACWQTLSTFQDLQAHLEEITTPFLTLHAAGDTRTAAAGSEALYKRAMSGDKTFRRLPGSHHLLLLGLPATREMVTREIMMWILQRANKAS